MLSDHKIVYFLQSKNVTSFKDVPRTTFQEIIHLTRATRRRSLKGRSR